MPDSMSSSRGIICRLTASVGTVLTNHLGPGLGLLLTQADLGTVQAAHPEAA